MNELQILTIQRDELLGKIREIEASCEGIENENNAKKVQELNLEQARYSAQRQEVATKLADLDRKISSTNAEILKLSGTGVERILEAIKEQRWYLFKNKTNIVFEKNKGVLFTNQNYIYSNMNIKENDARQLNFSNIIIDEFREWKVCDLPHYEIIIQAQDFPGLRTNRKCVYMHDVNTIIDNNGKIEAIWTDSDYPNHSARGYTASEGKDLMKQ